MKKLILGLFCGLLMWSGVVLANGDIPQPVFEEGEFWEFDLKVSNSNRSNLPSGLYKIVFRNGRLKVQDVDNPGALGGNLPIIPGLLKKPIWFKFPLELGGTVEMDKGTVQVSKTLVEKNDCMTAEMYLPVKGPGTITYYYCPEKKSVVFAKAEYPTSVLEIKLIRHSK